MPEHTSLTCDWALTARQRDCLERFWSRKSAKEIAQELGITHHSVEKHLLAARQSLGVATSIEAARIVFGSPAGTTVRPYYDPSDVSHDPSLPQLPVVPQPDSLVDGTASEKALINSLGPAKTLLAILAIAIGSILGVAALIAAAQGMTQLWSQFAH
jgi:DNA-binding CsgD family transcriptional regulator